MVELYVVTLLGIKRYTVTIDNLFIYAVIDSIRHVPAKGSRTLL